MYILTRLINVYVDDEPCRFTLTKIPRETSRQEYTFQGQSPVTTTNTMDDAVLLLYYHCCKNNNNNNNYYYYYNDHHTT